MNETKFLEKLQKELARVSDKKKVREIQISCEDLCQLVTGFDRMKGVSNIHVDFYGFRLVGKIFICKNAFKLIV